MPVRMIKGVGPQRAELLAKRGLHTLEDLLAYLPFRYEDRIHFSNIKDIQPNGIYTIRVQVMSGQAVRTMGRGRDAIFHLLVRDSTGQLPCKFFHGGYLENRLKPGQLLILHGKAEIDKLRPARIEMVNPQMELIGEQMDSTEVGRIVPIYEAIGTFGSRVPFDALIYAALEHTRSQHARSSARGVARPSTSSLRAAKPSSTRISRRRAKTSMPSTPFARPRNSA